jgi:hypothetical protein
VADWHWEPVTDDLLDGLSPAAQAAVHQVAEELAVRESMIFLDGREFTGEPPGLRTVQRHVSLNAARGPMNPRVLECAPHDFPDVPLAYAERRADPGLIVDGDEPWALTM